MKRLLWSFALLMCGVSAMAQAPKWKIFISKEGRFSVKLPARPKYSAAPTEKDSVQISSVSFLLDRKETAYYISYTDFKPEVIKAADATKLLDGARNGGVANVKGKLLSEKNISLDGNPGREIAFDMPATVKTKARARFYIVDNRLYTIIFAGPAAIADSTETDEYLASLKLFKPKTLPEIWGSVGSPEGRFTIKMPGKPTASIDQPAKIEAVHIWQVEQDSLSYLVSYNDVPGLGEKDEDKEKSLDVARDGLVKSISANVQEEKLLAVDGNPGRELNMTILEKDTHTVFLVRFRGFLVKNRYYQIMALGSKESMEKGRVEDFMDSFQLAKSPPVKE